MIPSSATTRGKVLTMGEEWLTVERCVNRDEKGALLPETIEVDFMEGKPKIAFLPIPRGKLQRLYSQHTETSKEQDIILIKGHLIKPDPSTIDFDEMSQANINALLFAIVSGSSGIPQAQVRDVSIKAIVEMGEQYIKKN